MNNINVLYKNSRFKATGYGDNDPLENFEFASDLTLNTLLKKASIPHNDIQHIREAAKKSVTNVVNSVFQKHPRNIPDESTISVDFYSGLDIGSTEISLINNALAQLKQQPNLKDKFESPYAQTLTPAELLELDNLINADNIMAENTEMANEKKSKKSNNDKINNGEDVLGVKLNSTLVKIEGSLRDIRAVIHNGVTPEEGEEDVYRREKRAMEFSSRFSRNYLYPLGRQLMAVRRHTCQRTSSKSHSGATSPSRALPAACQTVLQALQAYCHHIPNTTVGAPIHVKFCDLLQNTCELCRLLKKLAGIYYDINTSFATVEDIESYCKLVMQDLQENLLVKKEADCNIDNNCKNIQPRPKKSSIIQRNKSQLSIIGNSLPFHKRHSLEKRLSMYSVAYKKTLAWKRNAAALAKHRFNIQSRYKNAISAAPTAVPPNKPQPPVPLRKPAILTTKRSSRILEASRSSTEPPENHDNVTTMVQVEESKKAEGVVQEVIRARLEPVLQEFVAQVASGSQDDAVLARASVRDGVLEKLRELLNQVQHGAVDADAVGEGVQQRLRQLGQGHETADAAAKQTETEAPRSYVTVTGPKNAKLVCIKDASCYQPDPEPDSKILNAENEKEYSATQPQIVSEKKGCEAAKSDTEPVKSEGGMVLPKKFIVNIIQYKLQFHKYTKPNHMYKKTSTIQPWNLTSKISDQLLSDLLTSVLAEIEMNQIVEKVYRAEFE